MDSRDPTPDGALHQLFSSGFNRYHIFFGLGVVGMGIGGFELIHWLSALLK
ncbi:MAG: hypothetical protein K9N62_02590 [Verrucomicrobia bacterium]|jgi:hypothetical protein|nr:hypothetical protein [Verrucomicrobiota bacterium]